MTSSTFRYPAYRVTQTHDSRPLYLFAAPAVEIDDWVGVPQRGRLDGGETVGFQRQENHARVQEIAEFFGEAQNVVQNPLLCALQDSTRVSFESTDLDDSFGYLTVVSEDLSALTLRELIGRVIGRLEGRVPSLASQPLDQSRLGEVLARAGEIHELEPQADDGPEDEGSYDDDEAGASANEDAAGDVASVLLTEETQLVDFYQELRVRAEVLSRISSDEDPADLLGFTKSAMISYLQPVVLVDGQHRLRGAVTTAKALANTDAAQAEVRSKIDAGHAPDSAYAEVVSEKARNLPVSLLFDDAPSEHVFQFVVVNQKATPIGNALLGTIVSTSLSRDEMEPVAQRLRNAGIRLEDSQAVAYLTRADESPFKGLVQTGITGENKNLLQWNVLKGLTTIFRELKGGRLYHQTVDYAAKWRRRELSDSSLVADGTDASEKYEIWSAPDGPWREIFVRFFTLVRDRFADDDPEAHNAWGNSAGNLFNKISLTILAADYFQFLDDRRRALNSVDDVDESFEEWLEGVNDTYFARDWRMGSLKKDQRPCPEEVVYCLVRVP